ncbi:MAG: hypothetical protein HUU15_10770 [Candidatus Brocadiae bacterium]|nr:hypothetical protein [Candidatus Brocadiia bacterium]
MSARFWQTATLFAALLAGPSVFAQGADEESFKSLFREGVEAYKRGQAKEAYEKLEQALRIKVDDRLVLYMRDEVGYAVLTQMMAEGGEIRQTALRILEYAKGRAESFKRSTEEREKLVEQMDSDSFPQTTEAMHKLMNCGTWACENLVAHLGDTKSERLRTNVIVCLSKMAEEATLAVAEALNSTDKLTRQNACVVLGNIGDIRGLAELRRVVENGSEAAEVKSFAQSAIDRIMKAHPEESAWAGKSAKETYVGLAERWYRSHPSVMHYMFGDHLVWRWSPSKDALVGREVPPFALNEELAEEACHDAIALDNNFLPAWSLIACVSYQQEEEGRIALEDGESKLAIGDIKPEDLEGLKKELANIDQAGYLGQMGGTTALFLALEKSLADETAQVSAAICRALARTAKWEELPGAAGAAGTPLSEALKNGDKRVRYAAAEAVAALFPQQSVGNSELVVPNLAEAVGEQSVRVVLLIEPDDNTRGQMREALNGMGCYVVEAPDAARGLMKAKEFPTEDVIICDGTTLNQVVFSVSVLGKNQSEASVLDSLQEDLRTRQIPIIVTGGSNEDVSKWQGIFKTEVKDYSLKTIDAAEWKKKLDPIFAEDKVLNRSKRRAEESAIRAAEAIASIRIQDTAFTNFASAVGPLAGALEGRPDTIRIPVCKALGALGQADQTAIDALSKVLADPGNDKGVRCAAAEWGLARIFQQSGATPNEDCVKALIAGITDADNDVQRATSRAIGAAKMSNEQRAAIFAEKRLHGIK